MYYVRSRINGKKVSLHRYITNCHLLEIDHINHDTLDNQLHNLRVITHSNNMINRRHLVGTTSIYKGVCWDKSRLKWEAYIHYNNKRHHLGRFSNEFDAAIAYNDASFIHHKEFANVNRLPYGIARCLKEEIQL